MPMQVDVIINVFGKPLQTGLSLLTLMKHSGKWIDRIYYQEEPMLPPFEAELPAGNVITIHRNRIKEVLGGRIETFVPEHFNFTLRSNTTRLVRDTNYRLSMRYQYGFERSDKDFVLLIHNDIRVKADVVGAMLDAIGDHAGVGVIGTCEICPAHHLGKCERSAYSEYRPNFLELKDLYDRFDGHPEYRRRYDFFNANFRQRPWPLPECRLCEWACLINLKKTRPLTMPKGQGMPIGTYPPGGSSNLDIGAAWFRDMNAMGLTFKHFDVEPLVDHAHGHMTLCDARLHYYHEFKALKAFRREFPEYLLLEAAPQSEEALVFASPDAPAMRASGNSAAHFTF
jgi:hypothetical protein